MSEKQPVNPAEIQKDLKDFIEKKYGAQVVFPQAEVDGIQEGPQTAEDPDPEIEFDLKPEELEAFLDEYVIKQVEAKEVLATKICTHFNRMKLDRKNPDQAKKFVGNIKNNILLIGPTGVGKTYLIKLIAQRIGVPFVKGDATKFSETGYVGGDVEDLVRELVREAGGHIEKAQYGIIYVDEIDKIASSSNVAGPDVSRTGVQRNLLKLMEETEVDLKAPHDLASQMETMMQFQRSGKMEHKKINTRNILFIVSGAFGGLEDTIQRRLNKKSLGFRTGAARAQDREIERTTYLKQVRSEDLIEFGFESEFVGRLPVLAVLEPLSVKDLYQILSNPNCAVTLGKKRDFEAYGIALSFDDDALHRLAELAAEEQTGARALVSVCERALLKFEKTLPSTDIRTFTVTAAVVDHPEVELGKLLVRRDILSFTGEFEKTYGIRLQFEDDALASLAEEAHRQGVKVATLCRDGFNDYGHGLKLLGKTEFTVGRQAAEHPKQFLDGLVKAYYNREKS
ncbi:MAG: AAA family ATPase [bacterium]|nr:AAA family ATPase [bacterium]